MKNSKKAKKPFTKKAVAIEEKESILETVKNILINLGFEVYSHPNICDVPIEISEDTSLKN